MSEALQDYEQKLMGYESGSLVLDIADNGGIEARLYFMDVEYDPFYAEVGYDEVKILTEKSKYVMLDTSHTELIEYAMEVYSSQLVGIVNAYEDEENPHGLDDAGFAALHGLPIVTDLKAYGFAAMGATL